LWFAFDVGYQNYTQFTYEWIAAPATPPNIYADFLKAHKEGIQHLGMPVDDLSKAVSNYEKLGYQEFGRRQGYYEDGGDALRLQKSLGRPEKRHRAVK